MKQTPRLSKTAQKRIADYRKAALVQSGHVYRDLANLADSTYSMADKWMNVRRTSASFERAFQTLTGKPAWLNVERERKAS